MQQGVDACPGGCAGTISGQPPASRAPQPYAGSVLEDFGGPDHTEDERASRPRWGRRLLLTLLGFVFLGVVAVAVFLAFLNMTVSRNVSHEPMLPGVGPQGVDVPRDGIGTNYLIIGSDAREGDTFSRADVIVLAHIPEDSGQVFLIHFPRDLYVDIPGHGKDKINAAYAFGEAPLLVRTLQNLLGIRIDHVAKTDFEGFKNMTDAVGGVRVYAVEASSGQGNGGPVVIKEGWNDLNGEQALAFVRERYELSQGDISRGERQMAFIKALLSKIVSRETLTNPLTIAEFTDAASANLVVDDALSIADMRSQVLDLRGIRSDDVQFITAPWDGFGTTSSGASIVVVDKPAMKLLGEYLRKDDVGSYNDISTIP